LFDLAQTYFTRGIEDHLRESKRLRRFCRVNWLLALLHWPEVCCRSCGDGSTRSEGTTRRDG
jgi:hypothetical protein